MRISVIIPTLNRSQTLDRTIASVRGQALSFDQYEIIIVDNGSTDRTRKLVDSLNVNGSKPLRLIQEPELGLHNARHAGARVAKGEILVFTDDDTSFDRHWLAAYAEAFESHPEMIAAGGPVRPVWGVAPPQWLLNFMGASREFPILSLMEPYEDFRINAKGYFYGVNMAIRRRALFELGGFNPEAFGDVWLGDGESGLNYKLWARAMPVGYVPNAIVYHHIPAERMTVRYFCRRMANQGACDMYTRYHPRIPPRFRLLKHACAQVLKNSGSWIKAFLTKEKTDTQSLQIQLHSAQTLSEVKYTVRLILDEKFRGLVRQTSWL